MKQNKYRERTKEKNKTTITEPTKAEINSPPNKTKQMGNIDTEVKIYLEDYVYTYLYQYGKHQNSQEKVALLVGKHYQLNGQDTVVISGAIIGKHSENIGGIEFFTEKSWEYIGAEIDKYFQGMVTVGWAHILEGSGGFYTDVHLKLHREFFKEDWQQIFIIDPSEKLDYFYSCNNKYLEQRDGYFIYYDKNKEMQEYMLDNNMSKEKASIDEIDICNKNLSENAILNFNTQDELMPKTNLSKQNINITYDENTKPEKNNDSEINSEQIINDENINSPLSDLKDTSENLNSRLLKEDPTKDMKKILQKRAKEFEEAQKERHTMLVGASCTLCLLIMCMGVSLNNSVKRIDNLEGDFQSVQTSYEKLEENLDIKVQAAFATQQEVVVMPTVATISDTVINKIHIVEDGETLAKISRIYYNTEYKVADIMEENGITNADFIYVGQKLRIP